MTNSTNTVGQGILASMLGSATNPNNSNSTNELNFLNRMSLMNSGIGLLKANSNINDWEKVNYNPNTNSASNNPCK